jgi:hypothetical protein
MMDKNDYYLDADAAEIAKRVLDGNDVKMLSEKIGEKQSVLSFILKGKKKTTQSNLGVIVEYIHEKIAILSEELKNISNHE